LKKKKIVKNEEGGAGHYAKMAIGMTPILLFGGYYGKKTFESLYNTFS